MPLILIRAVFVLVVAGLGAKLAGNIANGYVVFAFA